MEALLEVSKFMRLLLQKLQNLEMSQVELPVPAVPTNLQGS